MTTLGEAIELVRSRLDETVAKFFTDVELRAWVNAGVKDISRRTELNQTRATINVLAGTQEYTLPTDLIRLNRIEFKATNDTRTWGLTYRDVNNMDEVWFQAQKTRQGTPVYYTLWGMPPTLAVILWPVPQAAGQLTVWYYKQPAEALNTSTVLAVPMGWDDALVDYCEFNALRKGRDPRWQEAKALYEEKINELMVKTARWTDQQGMIVGDGPGPVPAWLAEE